MPKAPQNTPASPTPVAPTTTRTPSPRLPKPSFVIVENKLNQPLDLSIINDEGAAVGFRLPPHGMSAPVRSDRLTPQIQRLVNAGSLRLR